VLHRDISHGHATEAGVIRHIICAVLGLHPQKWIAEKRRRLEETLWSMHEADVGDFFETVEVAKSDKDGNAATDETGKMLTVKKQRPRLLSDLCPSFIPSCRQTRNCARCSILVGRRSAILTIYPSFPMPNL
jgi:hypothetical protein